MKKNILNSSFLTLLFLIIIIGTNQVKSQSPLDPIFEKYSNEKGFNYIVVDPEMLGLFVDKFSDEVINDDESDNQKLNDINKKLNKNSLKDVAKSIQSLKILSCDKEEINSKRDFKKIYNEILKKLPKKTYKDLLSVNVEDTDVKFLVKKDANGKNTELVLVVNEESELVLIDVLGDIDLSKISEIAKKIPGLDALKGLDMK